MLKITDLTVKYNATDEHPALDSISLSVRAGEKIALLGANGAGKSTLLLSICGVLAHTSGMIEVNGVKMDKKTLRKFRQSLGMVFQNPDDQLFMPSLKEDIAFGPLNYGVSADETEKRIDKTLERLHITHLKDRLSHKLSGGEKRLAALAGVLVMQPSVLLLDEPSSFLDPRARRELINVLGGLSQAMLIATHDMDMALDLCHRAVVLKNGRIFADAPAQDVLRDKDLLEECGLELPLSLIGR